MLAHIIKKVNTFYVLFFQKVNFTEVANASLDQKYRSGGGNQANCGYNIVDIQSYCSFLGYRHSQLNKIP